VTDLDSLSRNSKFKLMHRRRHWRDVRESEHLPIDCQPLHSPLDESSPCYAGLYELQRASEPRPCTPHHRRRNLDRHFSFVTPFFDTERKPFVQARSTSAMSIYLNSLWLPLYIHGPSSYDPGWPLRKEGLIRCVSSHARKPRRRTAATTSVDA
jgi:hypothetical protein